MTITVICPHDGTPLISKCPTLHWCPFCQRSYPVENGVLRLLECSDPFYEGVYENQVGFMPRSERFWHRWPLWLINSGYPRLVRKHAPAGGLVVELGCAGGIKYFGQRYQMVGCDLSLSALGNLNGVYECLIQADASACIPLPDSSVDAIVSSYFWEHIPHDVKPRILSECSRILKPGGRLVFLYDVETSNPLISYYKKSNLDLYNRLFLEEDGHVGYERPEANLAAFRVAGFHVLEHRGMDKTWLQSPSVYSKLAKFGGSAQRLFGWTKVLGRAPWFYVHTLAMRVIDSVVCPFLPKEWARIDIVVCRKQRC